MEDFIFHQSWTVTMEKFLSLEMRDNIKKELCIDTFINVIKRYDIHCGILHSDRGSQYTGEEFLILVFLLLSSDKVFTILIKGSFV